MENLYLKLLHEFDETGLSSKRSISKFMEQNFKKPVATDSNIWYKQNEDAVSFLNDVKNTGHFEFDLSQQYHIGFNQITQQWRWYDVVNIDARLTISGLEFLETHNVNKRVTDNAIKQTNILYLTALFTVCNLIFAIISLNSSRDKGILQTQLQAQSQQIHT